jgi:hypothetical protein
VTLFAVEPRAELSRLIVLDEVGRHSQHATQTSTMILGNTNHGSSLENDRLT